MAFRCLKLLNQINRRSVLLHNSISSLIEPAIKNKINKPQQFKTEKTFVHLDDPDTFGTITRSIRGQEDKLEDEDDIKEDLFLTNKPVWSQKLTTKQYADIIKQYLAHKRLKEAIDVLEIRMLTEDRVKPENYIYNILIGACADVGYTKKAFKLFNDMKKRALKPTGDTYTCLFHACANSPWSSDGLKKAQRLRELMIEKGVEPNLTNYNAMIKAFGRCGDLATAFKIVDEMVSKKIKIRVHTFNHLLHACISDKDTGLRYALIVWRKMLKMREKPNLFSFNLILKCVKVCNMGTKSDIEELITLLQEYIGNNPHPTETLQIESSVKEVAEIDKGSDISTDSITIQENTNLEVMNYNRIENSLSEITLQHIPSTGRTVPNLLSKVINMQQVTGLQQISSMEEKFAVIGGQEDFLKEMEVYSVKPDIKTFTQMIPLINNTQESENKLLKTIKSLDIKCDIDFYNNLIKKRCLRFDYDGALELKEVIKKENEYYKRRYKYNKKLRLKFNIMTYGVLAMACRTKETAENLLKEMKENQLKINIEIFGTLLKCGIMENNFDYVLFIMNAVKEENIIVNKAFLDHLKAFNKKCSIEIKGKQEHLNTPEYKSYKNFVNEYKNWEKGIDTEAALKSEHPWHQFMENHPTPVQRENINIKIPKKFYKRNKKFVSYVAKL